MLVKEIKVEQRSDEWHNIKEGKISASTISTILGKETLKSTKNAIDNYALEKAIELLHGKEDVFVNFDMQRGINHEPLAFKLLSEIKGCEFLECKESGFWVLENYAGSSPDGLIYQGDELKSVIEIKCPKKTKFFKIVAKGEEVIDKNWIDQMQMQMLCTNTKECCFFIYYLDEETSFQYFHEITIQRDEERIELIKERCKIVNEKINVYVKQLEENEQF